MAIIYGCLGIPPRACSEQSRACSRVTTTDRKKPNYSQAQPCALPLTCLAVTLFRSISGVYSRAVTLYVRTCRSSRSCACAYECKSRSMLPSVRGRRCPLFSLLSLADISVPPHDTRRVRTEAPTSFCPLSFSASSNALAFPFHPLVLNWHLSWCVGG